ncbi:MAG: polysaccharide deacetylase family protein [Clostridiales bacterium]|nr:polysaccharide deacetylase family protein [Clostridiales bacterium]
MSAFMKAVTFSYDDGVTQDQRLIDIFDRYGLKCTFNINSGLLGTANSLLREDVTVAHVKPLACEVRNIYKGHEIAAHTLTHPCLCSLPDEEVVRQVEEDRLALSELAGYEVVGMAYPGGGTNHDARVVRLIREHTGIKYARTIISNNSFDLQDDLLEFRPTVYHHESMSALFEVGKRFLAAEASAPQILYVWGHAYEFDIHNTWREFEEFCRMISGRPDIFYGTNREVLLGK